MARNISISVSVQDQYSQSISSMREKTVVYIRYVRWHCDI